MRPRASLPLLPFCIGVGLETRPFTPPPPLLLSTTTPLLSLSHKQQDIMSALTEHGVDEAQERLRALYPDAIDSQSDLSYDDAGAGLLQAEIEDE